MRSGRIDPAVLLLFAVTAVSLVAAATDVVKGRIYNWLTAPALLGGLAFAAWQGGWSGLGESALGAVAGLVLFGWMFALGAMGGGDVKLLMALGAWGGPGYAQEVAILSVLLGGIMAFAILVATGRIVAFARKLWRLVLTVFVRELELEVPAVDRKLTMPFGIPIGAAAIWSAWAHPLFDWGFRPWP